MKILRDLVLIKADIQPDKMGSIYIVEEWKSLPPTGEVLAVGPLVKSVKVGDKVLFERYASIILEDDKRISKEDNIFGIIDENL